MLLRVILKNFLSFDEEVQFDMFPNTKRTSLDKHYVWITDELPVLKMAAIYGANGAGKSNLLKAIDFLKDFTTKKDFLGKIDIEKYFYALKKNAGQQPMELMTEFVTSKGEAFIYMVEIDKKGVKTEILKKSGLGSKDHKEIFTRERNKIMLDLSLSEEIRNLVSSWLKNNPYSSLLVINENMPVLRDRNINTARQWFKKELDIINIRSFIPNLISLLKNNSEINRFATFLFSKVGLGINTVKVETENFEDWSVKHDISRFPMEHLKDMKTGVLSSMSASRNTWAISVEDGIKKISQILFEQFGKDGVSKNMDIQAQSDGTVRLLSLIPAIYNAVKKGKTILIDELEHSIHPHLVRELVKYFSFEKTTGQLIFTTHQTCLLNQDFIRTDEVWLVEKQEGNSRLYSLNDFKIHNTINIENGYMTGRYGAIPIIGELNQ